MLTMQKVCSTCTVYRKGHKRSDLLFKRTIKLHVIWGTLIFCCQKHHCHKSPKRWTPKSTKRQPQKIFKKGQNVSQVTYKGNKNHYGDSHLDPRSSVSSKNQVLIQKQASRCNSKTPVVHGINCLRISVAFRPFRHGTCWMNENIMSTFASYTWHLYA